MVVTHNNWLARVRAIAGWLTISAFACVLVADNAMINMNPQGTGPWPNTLPMPKSFAWWLLIRNASLLVALGAGLISLPRWQSILGLTLTVIWFAIRYYLFATW